MRDGWTETTLGDIASWSSGKNLGSDKRNELGLNPILGANGIIGRTNEVLLDEELITVGRVGACGETHRSSGPVWISDNALIVIPAEQVTIDLLFYVLSTFDYQSIISGTTQPLITQSKMKSQIVNLPPLAAQKRIVDVVSSVDVYIDALQRQADTARIARNAVLDSLLEQVHQLSIEYSLKEIAVERGLIGGPFGSSLVSKDYQESGIPVIRGKNLSLLSGLVEGPYVYVSEQKAKELSRNMAIPGDLVATQRGTLGQVAVVPFGTFDSYIISQSQMRLRPKTDLTTKEFIYLQMSRKEFVNEILSREVSTANPHINLGIFSELKLKLPPLTEQKRIVEIVSSMDDVIQSTEQAVIEAKALRSGLLSDLLSGEHEIPMSYDKFLKAA
jgi:restriction endonuclease S subunit